MHYIKHGAIALLANTCADCADQVGQELVRTAKNIYFFKNNEFLYQLCSALLGRIAKRAKCEDTWKVNEKMKECRVKLAAQWVRC